MPRSPLPQIWGRSRSRSNGCPQTFLDPSSFAARFSRCIRDEEFHTHAAQEFFLPITASTNRLHVFAGTGSGGLQYLSVAAQYSRNSSEKNGCAPEGIDSSELRGTFHGFPYWPFGLQEKCTTNVRFFSSSPESASLVFSFKKSELRTEYSDGRKPARFL
mmetsp:Transcript_15592/g.26840  ORF Transcript_15592/g.26840 Transcript_15592/m.26840 type:complete len:160 (+) Transcript_15592:888-1367(+)